MAQTKKQGVMTKAEQRATELGYHNDPWNRVEYTANDIKQACIEGYQQAEKDFELTWEGMMLIHKCIKDAMNYHLYAFQSVEGQQKVYEEVLKRLKGQKGE